MLDVHPAHHAANSWRDFFVHIGTIVVGLLIAVGLEQTVERVHEHYQLRETREALDREALANDKELAANEADWREVFVQLKNNLRVLQYLKLHPGTAQQALPGDLRWINSPFEWKHSAWEAAERKGIVQYMNPEEADRHQEFYRIMELMSLQSLDTWNALNDASRFEILDSDPSHLSLAQLEEVIRLTSVAMTKHLLLGLTFGRLAHEFPERPHTLTWATLRALKPTSFDLDPHGMAAAHQATLDRLKAANGGPAGATIEPAALR